MIEKLDKLVGSIYYIVFMIMLLIVPFIVEVAEESKMYVLSVPFALFFFKVVIQAIAIKKRS